MATFLACEVGLTMGLQWLQIWALYDELDDMPRTWVRIMKVSRKPSFRAWFRWLEPLNLTLQERQWEQVKAVPFSLLDPPSCIWLLFFFLLSPSLLSCPWLLWVSSYLDNKHHRCASSFFMMPYALERDMREREREMGRGRQDNPSTDWKHRSTQREEMPDGDILNYTRAPKLNQRPTIF